MQKPQTNSKYEPTLLKRIYQLLRQGNMRGDAAVLSGISRETFDLWLNRYEDFKNGVEAAEGVNKKRTISLLQKHGKKSWQALAWWLERRFYSDYMSKTSTKIEGTGGVQIAIVSGGYIPPQLEQKQPASQTTEPSSLILEGHIDENENVKTNK